MGNATEFGKPNLRKNTVLFRAKSNKKQNDPFPKRLCVLMIQKIKESSLKEPTVQISKQPVSCKALTETYLSHLLQTSHDSANDFSKNIFAFQLGVSAHACKPIKT